MYHIIITTVITLIVILVVYIKWQHSFWKRKGVPYKQPNILFGNITPPWKGRITIAEEMKQWYEEAKNARLKYCGNYIFSTPILTVVDNEFVKRVLIKDFHHFPDRGFYLNERDDPLSVHLLSLEGEKWKNLRAKLAPAFTASKAKMMFQAVLDCTVPMVTYLRDNAKEAVNAREIFASYTIDTIGTCAFGIDCNSFKLRDNPFYLLGRRVVQPTRTEQLSDLLMFSFPELARTLGVKVTKPDVETFFMNITKETVEYREENNVKRNDIMQMLIDIKNSSPPDDPFTIEQLAAQAFIFFLGGFETSSTTGTFCLFELALNQEIQRKARDEVVEVLGKHEGMLNYEALQEMKYLSQVIDETMRKYPPLPLLNRICVKDYKLPDSDLFVEKGTRLIIPLLGLHHDPEYFPEPATFNPDRFSEANKNKIPAGAFLPFGEGPRICIGMRFGSIQTKVGLAVLLKHFKFTVNSKTEVPLKFDPQSFTLLSLSGIWLNIEHII